MAEYLASRASLTSVRSSDLGHGKFAEVAAGDVAAALAALEGTYFLRMAAEAERAMRIHLSTNFPTVHLSNRDGFGRLLSKCGTHFDPARSDRKMPAHLTAEVLTLTDYRNDQAHSLRLGFTFPDIYTAKVRLSRFLFALPA